MRNRIGNILWGLAFIVVGIGYGGNVLDLWDFELFFDGWWTLFIIVPSIIEIIKNGFKTVSVAALLIGCALLLTRQGIVDSELALGLVIPIVLVIIGIKMMLPKKEVPPTSGATYNDYKAAQGMGGKNKHKYSATFADSRYAVDSSEVFDGCSVNVWFGAFELDLRAARITENIAIDVSSNFGGVTIRLPQNVRAEVQGSPFLGGVNNSFYSNCEAGAPVVMVRAGVAFGNVDIK